jgi:hypothetical protein
MRFTVASDQVVDVWSMAEPGLSMRARHVYKFTAKKREKVSPVGTVFLVKLSDFGRVRRRARSRSRENRGTLLARGN